MAFDRPPADLRSTSPEEARELLARARRQASEAEPLSVLTTQRGYGPYRGYAEVLAAIERLADSGARLVVVGQSARGEPLFALLHGPERPDAMTRTSVVLSGVHPIEWIGVETHLRLLERIVERPPRDRLVVSFPVVNPDGFLRVEENLRAGRRRFVRHNARGVDLNRNFDAHWGEVGIVQRLLSFIFRRGDRPASEPEVEAIGFELSGRRVDRALSLHSFGGAVLYPSAASVRPVHDAAEHRDWARRIAKACDPRRPYRALPCSWFAMGMTAGGLELDWFHDRHGAISLLVECSRGGRGFRPGKWIQPFAWFNPPAVHETADAIAGACLPFVAGRD